MENLYKMELIKKDKSLESVKENALKELGESLNLDFNQKKELEITVEKLLSPENADQLANLNSDQIGILIRVIVYNELTIKPFQIYCKKYKFFDIYEYNNKIINAILRLSKSQQSHGFDGIINLLRPSIQYNEGQKPNFNIIGEKQK